MPIIASKGNSANVTFTNPQEIVISHADDSIKIGNGSNFLTVNADGSIPVASAVLSSRIDEASATVLYVGEAVTGTATSSAAWRIKKVTESGSVTAITWADGDSEFDNVWDNRVSLSYS